MLFYFETANKCAVWKENWVEFCNMAGKIRWIYNFFREIQVNSGGLNLAVFRQFRHIYTRDYFYPPQYYPS